MKRGNAPCAKGGWPPGCSTPTPSPCTTSPSTTGFPSWSWNTCPRAAPAADTRTASPADLESVVSDYYALLPQRPGNAWTRLGPQLQAQGQQNYEASWAQIADITVFSPPATTGNTTVHVGIELTKPDGTRIKEFHQLGLLTENGTPLINSDTVLHAETLTPPPPPAPKTKEQENKGDGNENGEDDKEGNN